MKFIQWTLAVIGSIVLLIVVAGFMIPSSFSVQRSIEINAAPRKVYDLIVEPKKWKDWSVWTRRDPIAVFLHGEHGGRSRLHFGSRLIVLPALE